VSIKNNDFKKFFWIIEDAKDFWSSLQSFSLLAISLDICYILPVQSYRKGKDNASYFTGGNDRFIQVF